MTYPVYFDMPGNISIVNDVVHIDMFDREDDMASGTEPANPEPFYVFSGRIVLPLPGFLDLYRKMSKMVGQIEAARVLTATARAGMLPKRQTAGDKS